MHSTMKCRATATFRSGATQKPTLRAAKAAEKLDFASQEDIETNKKAYPATTQGKCPP